MSESLYGFPITVMSTEKKSYLYFWKNVDLTIQNNFPSSKTLVIDTFGNTGAKGEGKQFLCHILNKFKEDPTSGVDNDTIVRLFACASCKKSIENSKSSVNKPRYSAANIDLELYYNKYGFVKEKQDSSWMSTNIQTILTNCQRGGTRNKSRKNKNYRNKKRSRRNVY